MLELVADPETSTLAPVEWEPVGSFQYEGDPDIPVGVTIARYRRTRATACPVSGWGLVHRGRDAGRRADETAKTSRRITLGAVRNGRHPLRALHSPAFGS